MSEGGAFGIELRLDGLHPGDSLRLEASAELTELTVGDMLVEVFAGESHAFTESEARDNPDLPDLYAQIAELFGRWRDGMATLRFYAPGGAEVDGGALVSDALGDGELRLVLRQTFEVLDWFGARGGGRAELVGWLSRSALLYAIDKHGLRVEVVSDGPLSSAALEIQAEGLAAPNEGGVFEVTVSGREFLGSAIAETESYIDRYDVFSDVLYDLDTRSVRFGTGHGEDLRVQVYESEGIDPIRAVFLLRLYDASLDEHPASWAEKVVSEDVFDWMLSPVLDRASLLGEDDLDWIIEAGFAENEEREEEARRGEAVRAALSRAHAEEGRVPG